MEKILDQIAMALARSLWSLKTLIKMDNVDGMIKAPAIPNTARQMISIIVEMDKAAPSEPNPKSARPISKRRFRPKRSPRVPVVINKEVLEKIK